MTAADFTFTTVNLPNAYVGVAYEAAIAYKSSASLWTAQSIVQTGALSGVPTGLALDTNGAAAGSLRLTGTPTGAASAGNTPLTGAGAYTFGVSGTDTTGTTASGTYTINLFNPTFTTTVLPPAFLGIPYEANISCGQSAPGSWALVAASASGDTGLPGGLTLAANDTRITGTPTGAVSVPTGSGVATKGAGFTYTFTLAPLSGGNTKQFSIQVYSSPSDPYYFLGLTNAQRMAILSGTDE